MRRHLLLLCFRQQAYPLRIVGGKFNIKRKKIVQTNICTIFFQYCCG